MKSRPQKPLLFEKLDYAYLLQFNRPAVHNAVNDVMMQALEAVLDKLEAAKDSLPVIISHVGNKTFCAGGDLKYFSSLDTPEKCRIMSLRMQSILDRLENCGHFVILAAKGQILGGGCEILTACHYAIVADNSQLSFRQAPNGIITGWGGGRRLIRKIGRANALRLTLSGERLSAEAAQRIGLAEEVIPIDEVLERAKTLCIAIADNDPNAVRGFLELEKGYRSISDERLITLETDTFVRLWEGNTFQTILNRFREGNK